MLTQSTTNTIVNSPAVVGGRPATDQFGLIAGHANLVATEFFYGRDEEIYGEDEPADYVYQVVRGAVRSYKLLSDGRRQIGA
ncbi:MAG: nitrogen fixation protein FixK, partial [Candidatus Afipia apatlaquensis]|nr:nitrogen fixation protein FixK [Candidatus Afipia apatlaquensis]